MFKIVNYIKFYENVKLLPQEHNESMNSENPGKFRSILRLS